MALAVKYSHTFTSAEGTTYNVQILKEGYVGSSTALTANERTFISTNWAFSDEDEYSPFLISTTTFSLYDTSGEDVYDDLVELLSDQQTQSLKLKLTDTDAGTLKWIGWIKRGTVTADEDGAKRLTIVAHDGIASLEERYWTSTASGPLGVAEDIYTGRVTVTKLLAQAILATNLAEGETFLKITSSSYPRLTGAPLTANGGQLGATQNPFDHIYIDRYNYRNKGKEDFILSNKIARGTLSRSEQRQITTGALQDPSKDDLPIKRIDVLRDVLTSFGCILFQWEGVWHVLQVNKRGNASYREWAYDTSGDPDNLYASGTVNYTDITSHIITPTAEVMERTAGTREQLPAYDHAKVSYQHGEFQLIQNPGFDFEPVPTLTQLEPRGWTVTNYGGFAYINNGNGDGQIKTLAIRPDSVNDLPTLPIGTTSGSADYFVQQFCDPSTGASYGDGTTNVIATCDTGQSGVQTELDLISPWPPEIAIPAGSTLWIEKSNNTYQEITTTADLPIEPDRNTIQFSSVDLGGATASFIRAKKSSYVESTSVVDVGAGERIEVGYEVYPRAQSDAPRQFSRSTDGRGTTKSKKAMFLQVKLEGDSDTYYLNRTTAGAYEWLTNQVAWVILNADPGSWNVKKVAVEDETPEAGPITVTIGPGLDFQEVEDSSGVVTAFDEILWDNVDVRVALDAKNPNRKGLTQCVYVSGQSTQLSEPKEVALGIGDAPIAPLDSGMSIDADGELGTEDWEEAPITGAESNVSHELLLGQMMLRSMRAPREILDTTFFDLPTLPGSFHVINRSGSDYAPMDINVDWNRDVTSGRWYKVVESGFTSANQIIYDSSAFVSSRGGIGEGAANFLQNIGSAIFADGSGAITRTDAVISSGTVTSISVETIVEPILKDEDLIVVVAPDLSFYEMQVSADQDALATSISVEDPDNPGTGVSIAEDIAFPAAVYFIQQSLMSLVRLGEQGFAVTVKGENLGQVDGAVSAGAATSISVKNWIATVPGGTTVYVGDAIDEEVALQIYGDAGLSEPVYKGASEIHFASETLPDISDSSVINPAGVVQRADFKVTADAITAYIGNPGDVIATVSGTPTTNSVPITGLTDDLKDGDPILIYTASGSVIKETVTADLSASGSPLLVTNDVSSTVASGDKIVPGSLTGLRIDMDAIEFTADTVKSSNYSAGTTGWALFNDGSAEFNSVLVQGNPPVSESNVTIRAVSFPISRPGGGSLQEGDVCIRTDEGDKPYTYTSGATWSPAYTEIDGGDITTGTINAARLNITSSSTFAAGYDPSDRSDVIRANGPTGPTTRADGSALKAGDVWIETDNGDLPYSWDGAAWQQAYTIIDGGNITTNTITANKLNITSLSAITASMGALNVDNTLTIGASGSITNSGGDYVLDDDGLELDLTNSSFVSAKTIEWNSGGTYGNVKLNAYHDGTRTRLANQVTDGSDAAAFTWAAQGGGSDTASMSLEAGSTASNRTFTVTVDEVKLNLPTSSAGLSSGTLWNDSGTVKVA